MDTGRRATLRLLVGENDLPVVVIVDRYGAAASASATSDHRFPDEEEVAATVRHLALQWPECGVSDRSEADEHGCP